MAKSKDRWPELLKLVERDDGMPVRNAGPWAEDKLYFWNRYIDITTRAMVGNPKWRGLVYVDLFAGPGVLRVKEDRRFHRIPGSPLIAAHAPKHFSRIIACEKDKTLAAALESRLDKTPAASVSHVVHGDCNDQIDEIARLIPYGTLTLAFVDPTGLHARFATVETLVKGRRVDLLVLIADRMDIVRNVARYAQKKNSKLDHFLGSGSGWRAKFRALDNYRAENICNLFAEIYVEQLKSKFNYKVFGQETMKKSANAPLYRILFASKNELGLEFWDKIRTKERSGQKRLDFER